MAIIKSELLEKPLLGVLLIFLSIWINSCGVMNPAGDSQTQLSLDDTSKASTSAVKISFKEEGIYQLSAEELEAVGFGHALDQPSKLKLYSLWGEHPLWSHGNDENLVLRFYGVPYDSVYTQENVYWLTSADDEAWMRSSVIKDIGTVPTDRFSEYETSLPENSYLARLEFEQNQRYVPQAEGQEHWYWSALSAPQSEDFFITISHPADGGRVKLSLRVWGSTEAVDSPDHHLLISINERQIADSEWDGKGTHQIETEFLVDWLEHGQNKVTVEAPGDTGVAVDLVQIDKITLQYPRLGVAEKDRLLIPAYREPFLLSGFSGTPHVYDITDPHKTYLVVDEFDLSVPWEGERGHGYTIVGPQGYLSPVSISGWGEQTDLRSPELGADYLAVGPTDLLEALEPLLEWRAEQGMKTAAIPLGAVYDQFNYGIPEPEAIQNFIRHATSVWEPSPRYVLLVGDASYDPKGYITPEEANRLPTFLVNTVYGGETASDVPFVQVQQGDENENFWPDLAVGRIPARTPEQVGTLVAKILSYENNLLKGEIQNKILAVADGQEAYFKTEAQAFLDLFPDNLQTDLYAPPPGIANANTKIQEYFHQKNQIIAYFGHGSVNMWGKDRLFNTEDVTALGNQESFPVVLNMTCLTGLFTHPTVESLAEALLWQQDGGAVAVLAPTSLTLPNDQSFLTRPLVTKMLEDSQARLGDVLLTARRQVPPGSSGTRDVMETFLLFGDPALMLAIP